MTVLSVSEYADKIMNLIDEDIVGGWVPATVTTFSELHNHVDANDYLEDANVPWGTDLPDADDPNGLVADVGDEITARLTARNTWSAPPQRDSKGRGLPFAEQSPEFRIAQLTAGTAGMVLADRSGLPVGDRITWFMDHDPALAGLGTTTRAVIRALVTARVNAEA